VVASTRPGGGATMASGPRNKLATEVRDGTLMVLAGAFFLAMAWALVASLASPERGVTLLQVPLCAIAGLLALILLAVLRAGDQP
jgi:hypothetical protein